MKRQTMINVILTGFACLTAFNYAYAGHKSNDCDVVAINGSGTRH